MSEAADKVSDPGAWLRAVRHSHDRLARLVGSAESADLVRQSACADWNVAQVLSHLGSQAEIFSMFVDAAVGGGEAPGREAFEPIWNAWNSRPPAEQATDSVTANERLVERLEGLGGDTLRHMRLHLFGQERDATGLLRMRLSEHAVHTWDVEVAFDPKSEVAAEAVELLIDGIPEMAGRLGHRADPGITVAVTTSSPSRRFRLMTGGVTLEPGGADDAEASVDMGAEAFLRLVYGRLSPDHPARGPVHVKGATLEDLQAVFAGF